MKKIGLIIILIILAGASIWFYQTSQRTADYYGLAVVPCLDPTLPIIQHYDVHIAIKINGHYVPLDRTIGHDPAHCLRELSTDDASGTIHIKTNDTKVWTLGDFFKVWHKNFNKNMLLGQSATNGHSIFVTLNGQPVATVETTLLVADSQVLIEYR